MKLYNSLTKSIEEFTPMNPPHVGMYTCGMTVYDFAHIGHGRKYVNDDIVKRTLKFLGYEVKHVQNVTDVGHLVSDGDDGEDKLEKGSRKFGKTVWEIADYFTKNFYESMDKLNIIRPDVIAKATDNIPEQIELVKTLIEKGFAYETNEAVYFDVTRFKNYGKLFGQQDISEKKVAVRDEVESGREKKHSADFALWFKRIGRFKDHSMHWESPWGDGFPGWHVECSAMSMKYLGPQFDIHTGGEDHLPIHHPNEIAQSEAATGLSPFAKYWLHTRFLLIDGEKMSKSLGNFYTISDIENKGYDPLSLRYLYLTTHYTKQMNFTWEALESAKTALGKLKNAYSALQAENRTVLSDEKLEKATQYQDKFKDAISDDLNMSEALAVTWEVLKSNIPGIDKIDLLNSFDEVLGLRISEKLPEKKKDLTDEVRSLIKKRDEYRREKNFLEADKIRDQLLSMGYTVTDESSSSN